MKVTAIKPQKRHPERVNVHVDGEFRLALAAEIAYGAPLRVDEEVTEKLLRELEHEDRYWKAREAALNLLSYRARTAVELRRRLRGKGYEDEVAERCVQELLDRGLVDDASFAEMFTRDRVKLRPRGLRRLVQELRAKGVDAKTAHAAVDEVWEQEDVSELELARRAAGKWSPRAGEDPQRARRRLYGFLARRGFGGDTVRRVMGELLGR